MSTIRTGTVFHQYQISFDCFPTWEITLLLKVFPVIYPLRSVYTALSKWGKQNWCEQVFGVQDAGCLPGTQASNTSTTSVWTLSPPPALLPTLSNQARNESFHCQSLSATLHFTTAIQTHSHSFYLTHVVVRNKMLLFPRLLCTKHKAFFWQSVKKIVCAFNVLWGGNEENMRKWTFETYWIP